MPIIGQNEKGRGIYRISLPLAFLFIFLFLLAGTEINGYSSEIKYFLEVIHRGNQETLLSIRVYPKDNFYLEYTNSRDLNPVIDLFQIGEEGYFYLLEERYPWYGVGQESHPSKEIYFEHEMVVVKINQKIDKLPLRIAYTVKQVLKFKNQEYLLNSLADSGEPIDIIVTDKGGRKKSE